MVTFTLLYQTEAVMARLKTLAVVTAGLSLAAAPIFAATQPIGVAMSEGAVLVNDTQTPGNTTVFDGSTIQTQKSASQVRLKDGAQIRFESDSRAKLYSDHMDLQQGAAKIQDYSATANGLNVRAEGKSSASVTMKGKVVEVAALTGDVHVFNAAGMNVANLLPGRALDLLPQDAGASSPTTLTGCAVKTGNNSFFTDETSNVTAELKGRNVTPGKRVQVTGTLVPNATPDSPATQVINVTSVKTINGVCRGAAGAAAAGAGAAGAGAAAATAATVGGVGATVGVSTAVIVGVGVAAVAGAAVGAAYGTGALGSSTVTGTSPQPPTT